MRQIPLFKNTTPLFHGGQLARGKRKTRRPLSTKRPLHLVLKAKEHQLFAHKVFLEGLARRLAASSRAKIYGLAVNHDHIHLVLRFPHVSSYRAFVRAFTGLISRRIKAGLWLLTPFTRVLSWG